MKKLTKIALTCSLAAVAGFGATFAGCKIETDHPKAEITIEFNEKTYVLKYQLYRNMYPSTVRHFIELADAGFYNDTIIHNYQTSDWYGGGYTYEEDAYEAHTGSSEAMAEYLTAHAKEQAYDELFKAGALTATVYRDVEATMPLPTLVGEFTNNDHTIKKGALTAKLGGLRMYYTAKDTKEFVYSRMWDGNVVVRNYPYQSATSLFAIQVQSSSSLAIASYCLFGQLENEDAQSVLSSLKTAVSAYTQTQRAKDSGYTFPQSATVSVDNFEQVADPGVDDTYSTPKAPIVVKTVKVTQY